MQSTETERDDEIRQLAYQIWQEEGCPDGREVQHWLKAQVLWEDTNRPQSKRKQSKAPKGRKTRRTRTTEREL